MGNHASYVPLKIRASTVGKYPPTTLLLPAFVQLNMRSCPKASRTFSNLKSRYQGKNTMVHRLGQRGSRVCKWDPKVSLLNPRGLRKSERKTTYHFLLFYE